LAVDAVALEVVEVVVVHDPGAVVGGLRHRVARALALVDQLAAGQAGGVAGGVGHAPLGVRKAVEGVDHQRALGVDEETPLAERPLGEDRHIPGERGLAVLIDIDHQAGAVGQQVGPGLETFEWFELLFFEVAQCHIGGFGGGKRRLDGDIDAGLELAIGRRHAQLLVEVNDKLSAPHRHTAEILVEAHMVPAELCVGFDLFEL
jgi:hypothetical protein